VGHGRSPAGGAAALARTARPAAARWSPEGQRLIRRARERLLSDGTGSAAASEDLVRPEIAASWRRSLLSGVDPCRMPTDPADPDRSGTPRLLRAAEPVLTRLVAQLAGTSTAVVLADAHAWILWRGAGRAALFAGLDAISASPGCCLGEERVGTNGLGTVVEERRPTVIVGGEHYQDVMQDFTCVGVPILDPLSRRLEGVLDLTCASRDTNELLLPLLTEAVREIEVRLREQATVHERALFEEFVARSRRRRSVAVASLNEEFLFTNSAAAQLFEPADHALLWDWARSAVTSGREITGRLTLTRDVVVDARCAPVDGGGPWPAGVVVTMVPTAGRAAPGGSDSAWEQLHRRARRLAGLGGPLLLHGEPGVGKARLARRLHERDDAGPCTVVDCRAGRPADLSAALADPRGTVVLRRAEELDGDGALTALVGAARARVVLTATRPDGRPGGLLDEARAALEVPPLRERAADLPGLVDELLGELAPADAPRPRCTAQALTALRAHPWPGNVRELRRVLAGAMVTAMHFDIGVRHLPEGYRSGPPNRPLARLESTERDAIVAALEKAGGNKDRAAADLGISRATIYRKLRRFTIG
jgi:transcriptional regulator of acetoin/glycerol metabolism